MKPEPGQRKLKLSLLRALLAVCDSRFNVSKAARAEHATQPSISRKVLELEHAVGQPIFIRRGRRFSGLTALGREVTDEARTVLMKCDNIMRLGESHRRGKPGGDLRVATTHTQARYVLPKIVRDFRATYPGIGLHITQGSPAQLVRQMEDNLADLAICTEALEHNASLRVVDSYRWNRVLIVRPEHSLAKARKMTLQLLAAHPLITYAHGFTGRDAFDDAFARAGVQPRVMMSAADADVIKAYVRLGIGAGVVAAMAFDEKDDADLAKRPLDDLFPQMRVRIAYHREKFVSEAMGYFIDLFQSRVTGKESKAGKK
ncbi:MAG: LysR substrate-binding domain-containing protein [Gammaproteobacteria bacterium]